MSLLVLNSSSKVAQGIIRHLHKSGKYENINCADLYPNYWGVQSQVNFLHSIDKKASKTTLQDTHIQDKPDLIRAISSASQVLYITHDYYTNVAAKTSLLTNAAKIVSQSSNVKGFVAVTPGEHDHYGESSSVQTANNSEKEAQQINSQLINIKSDLTFGKDATVVSLLVSYLQASRNITWSPASNGPAPIHTNCLAHGVAAALEGASTHAGKTFLAEGQKRLSWNDVLSILEQATQSHRQVNSNKLETVASPLTNNLLSELFLTDKYRNAVQYINQYTPLQAEGAASIQELGVKPLDFAQHYAPNSIKKTDANDRIEAYDSAVQQFIF